MKMAAEFRSRVKTLIVVEESDAFLEEQLILAGIKVDHGQDLLPHWGELDPALVATLLTAAGIPGASASLLAQPQAAQEGLPVRPPRSAPAAATAASSPCSPA